MTRKEDAVCALQQEPVSVTENCYVRLAITVVISWHYTIGADAKGRGGKRAGTTLKDVPEAVAWTEDR